MMRVRLNSFRGRWTERFGVGPDKLKLGLQRGFTIAEMLVVIVIIGLLAALEIGRAHV